MLMPSIPKISPSRFGCGPVLRQKIMICYRFVLHGWSCFFLENIPIPVLLLRQCMDAHCPLTSLLYLWKRFRSDYETLVSGSALFIWIESLTTVPRVTNGHELQHRWSCYLIARSLAQSSANHSEALRIVFMIQMYSSARSTKPTQSYCS